MGDGLRVRLYLLGSDRFAPQCPRMECTVLLLPYLGWAQQTVRQTIKRWQVQGLGGLWEAPGRGKKRSWQEEDWQVILKLYQR